MKSLEFITREFRQMATQGGIGVQLPQTTFKCWRVHKKSSDRGEGRQSKVGMPTINSAFVGSERVRLLLIARINTFTYHHSSSSDDNPNAIINQGGKTFECQTDIFCAQ